jgi:stage II sporulation protein AB (anti-sigma F factor)
MSLGAARSFAIPSRLDALSGLRAQVQALAQEHGFPPQAEEDLALCVHEAVSNAIVHGHATDQAAAVQVRIEPVGPALRVIVRDCGPGFDVEQALRSLDDPTEEPRGRGLRIIRSLADEVDWHDGGREVVLLKLP